MTLARKRPRPKGILIFAAMRIARSSASVCQKLNALHSTRSAYGSASRRPRMAFVPGTDRSLRLIARNAHLDHGVGK